MRQLTAAVLFTLWAATAVAADIDLQCDRTSDGKLTAVDALSALEEAVRDCRRNDICDADGDEEPTAADALALLRYVVGMPQVLQCSCLHRDECFEDEDCQGPGYPEGLFCNYTLCVECEQDADCTDGQVCDLCSFSCVEPAGS